MPASHQRARGSASDVEACMHAFESELDYVYTLLRCFGAGGPTRVVFQFPKRIEESEYRLLIGREGRFERLALPVGESIRLGRDAR